MAKEGINWTHQSVKQLAGANDPVATVERLARAKVLEALDAGWSGPPFNPLGIADLMKIPVEANSTIPDARIVPQASGLKIEFNPTQPRERLRFSIAHELAHALFPDVADEIRNRGGAEKKADSWQLEMLCNLAAAEFVMPIGSLSVRDVLPSIEILMSERRTFDVSAEAFLLRSIKVTTEPALMFCASPKFDGNILKEYRIDYTVPSRSWPVKVISGARLPTTSLVGDCTAAGQTLRGSLDWPGLGTTEVECVGISAYPGQSYPRVAGLVRIEKQKKQDESLTYVHGSVLEPKGTTPQIICQLVNDKARVWGGGIAKAASQRYPAAQSQFGQWFTQIPAGERLGSVHFVTVAPGRILASLVGQHGFGPAERPRVRYAALQNCFMLVAQQAIEDSATVHMPKVGTGQAGGAWNRVEELVLDELVSKGVKVIVYDLPPQRLGASADLFA